MKMQSADPRIEAARYLAEAVTGVHPDMLLRSPCFEDDGPINGTYERAIRMHRTCGCERSVRLTAARDILLGVSPAAAGELRLAL